LESAQLLEDWQKRMYAAQSAHCAASDMFRLRVDSAILYLEADSGMPGGATAAPRISQR